MHEVRWLASPRQGELTHTRSVCVGVAETGGKKQKQKEKAKSKKQKQPIFLFTFLQKDSKKPS